MDSQAVSDTLGTPQLTYARVLAVPEEVRKVMREAKTEQKAEESETFEELHHPRSRRNW